MAPQGSRIWTVTRTSPVRQFPTLLYREAYELIFRFLNSKLHVHAGLTRLDSATNGRSIEGMGEYLAAEEKRFGFSASVQRIEDKEGLIRSALFWTYLYARRPLTDLGAREIHGAWTHRVQWVLIGQWNERSGLPLGPTSHIGELYGNLGASNARKLNDSAMRKMNQGRLLDDDKPINSDDFISLWRNLLDDAADNPTEPEFLHGFYIRTEFPALHARLHLT